MKYLTTLKNKEKIKKNILLMKKMKESPIIEKILINKSISNNNIYINSYHVILRLKLVY